MRTTHRLLLEDAREMPGVEAESIDCVITSPPYPMIEMWDGVFSAMSPEIGLRLERGEAWQAFELMHRELDRVWAQCSRVLRPGGFACINVGDATRTLDGEFRLYPNHARIVEAMLRIGLTPLPDILWRKPTNAPNKFLGSGMLPAGAYVTYEHEYILIFRKGPKRAFATDDGRELRMRSAFFWEERNAWFSDVWMDLRGASQELGDPAARERSAAFPFEVPYRLVQMLTLQGDAVLDPFLGTGTTSAAAAASARSSVGLDMDPALLAAAERALLFAPALARRRVEERLEAHRRFVEEREAAGKPLKHRNRPYGFPVVTGQEVDLELLVPSAMRRTGEGRFEAEHRAATPSDGDRSKQAELPF
ncbi:MAG: site-specific DNA-methyltransferase [Planctomycetes bacterium]|nr:site-specific DNA-methyltransferase [Planctomycetota bacterium]